MHISARPPRGFVGGRGQWTALSPPLRVPGIPFSTLPVIIPTGECLNINKDKCASGHPMGSALCNSTPGQRTDHRYQPVCGNLLWLQWTRLEFMNIQACRCLCANFMQSQVPTINLWESSETTWTVRLYRWYLLFSQMYLIYPEMK